jgi:predicted PurR-regulated permease PerM
VFAPMFLEKTVQVLFVEDRKSRSSDYFSVVASLSVNRFDLAFTYDVISILLVVLFCFFFKKKWGEFARFIFSWRFRYCMSFCLISQSCKH